MARHMLPAITSYRKGMTVDPCFFFGGVCPFLPQAVSFDTSLAETSIENETALDAFEHGFPIEPRHFSQKELS